MQDFVPLGTGNSRSLKSSISAGATWEQALEMLRNGTFPIDIGAVNDAGVAQKGTPLNMASLLASDVSAKYDKGDEAVPNDIFDLLSRLNSELGNDYIWRKYRYIESVGRGERRDNAYIGMYEKRRPDSIAYVRYANTVTDLLSGRYSVFDCSKYNSAQEIANAMPSVLKGKFITKNFDGGFTDKYNTVFLFPNDATLRVSNIYVIASYLTAYPSASISTEFISYLNGKDRGQYPDGASDGYEYEFMGMIGDILKQSIVEQRIAATEERLDNIEAAIERGLSL